uniref:Uncharacterized protein n=1 Tax=Rhizophora mucronata TaxID=61149 RepID=A0A2P2KEU9_RHIMU
MHVRFHLFSQSAVAGYAPALNSCFSSILSVDQSKIKSRAQQSQAVHPGIECKYT